MISNLGRFHNIVYTLLKSFYSTALFDNCYFCDLSFCIFMYLFR